MHNLAIALQGKGYRVTGSDDEIFEPSRSRLEAKGLLPKEAGWFPERLDDPEMVIILGMHALPDNPELLRAQELGLRIYSYPEYLFEQTRDKTRVVIAGSHGKTTITAMVIHVLSYTGRDFDYMVGSQIDGFENMVALSEKSPVAVFEGDEYLSSPIDLRPKFIHYKPHIALITGIAWDHINVFPQFDQYVEQFSHLVTSLPEKGHLFYFGGDEILNRVCNQARKDIHVVAYYEHEHVRTDTGWKLSLPGGQETDISLFGRHNFQNISGAKMVCNALGVDDRLFYEAISRFPGTRKRLQTLHKRSNFTCYLDFAHSPSKVRATVQAVKENHPSQHLVAILELHSFSSLTKEFIPHYRGTLDPAEEAVVYYDKKVLERKGLEDFKGSFLLQAFQHKNLRIINRKEELSEYISALPGKDQVLLLMSSGNFSGLDLMQVTL